LAAVRPALTLTVRRRRGPSAADADRPPRGYASFTIAMIAPASTKTTIAACIQIHVGDTRAGYATRLAPPAARASYACLLAG
jgi:hypothetical protein